MDPSSDTTNFLSILAPAAAAFAAFSASVSAYSAWHALQAGKKAELRQAWRELKELESAITLEARVAFGLVTDIRWRYTSLGVWGGSSDPLRPRSEALSEQEGTATSLMRQADECMASVRRDQAESLSSTTDELQAFLAQLRGLRENLAREERNASDEEKAHQMAALMRGRPA
jgi:DNA repair exonuclease SbcCD ATPase subunit